MEKKNEMLITLIIIILFPFFLFNEPTCTFLFMQTKISYCYCILSMSVVLTALWKIFPFSLQMLLACQAYVKATKLRSSNHSNRIITVAMILLFFFFFFARSVTKKCETLWIRLCQILLRRMITNYHINCSCVQWGAIQMKMMHKNWLPTWEQLSIHDFFCKGIFSLSDVLVGITFNQFE